MISQYEFLRLLENELIYETENFYGHTIVIYFYGIRLYEFEIIDRSDVDLLKNRMISNLCFCNKGILSGNYIVEKMYKDIIALIRDRKLNEVLN